MDHHPHSMVGVFPGEHLERERELFFTCPLEVTYYSYCPILLIEAVTESTQVQGEGRLTLYLLEEWKTLEG